MDNNKVIEEAVTKELETWSKLEGILKENTRDNPSEFLTLLKAFKPIGIETKASNTGLEFKVNPKAFKEFIEADLLASQRSAGDIWVNSYDV